MGNQHGLTIFRKQHQIPFPVARLSALMNISRTLLDRHAFRDAVNHSATFTSTPTSFAFAPRQVVSPAIVLSPPDLSIDKPIDGLIADNPTVLSLEPASDLGWRPASPQSVQNLLLQCGISQQSAASPAAAFRLLFSVGRLIAHLSATVSLELTGYSRWLAIHSCRDLADCFPGVAESGKLTALFKRKVSIASSHRNTLYKKCCTSSVNLGHPGLAYFHPTPLLSAGVRRRAEALLRLKGSDFNHSR